MTEIRYLSSPEIGGWPRPPSTSRRSVRFRQRGEGAPAQPRTRLDSESPQGMLTGYFAILPETGAMGGYTYSAGFQSNDAHFVLPLFDSGGTGIETVAAAKLLDDRACKAGVGTSLELSPASEAFPGR